MWSGRATGVVEKGPALAMSVATASESAMTKHKTVRRGKKSKKRKAEEEPQDAQAGAVADAAESHLPEPKKSKQDTKSQKKEKKTRMEKKSDQKSTDLDDGAIEHANDHDDPPADAVTISAADAASGMDIDRALKLAEKQRQKDKRAAKKAKAERDAAKGLKQARKYRATTALPPHGRRDSETPVWEACKEYLETWKRTRTLWKFQKVRQVWLLQHMYNTEQVSNDTFAIMVEYLKGLKGAGRTATLAEAEKVLSESASAEGPHSTEDSEESVVQQRAAAVIKVLQQFEQ